MHVKLRLQEEPGQAGTVKDCQIFQDIPGGTSMFKFRLLRFLFYQVFLARPLCTSVNSHILSVSVSLCDTGNHVELATFLGSISSESMQHVALILSFLHHW